MYTNIHTHLYILSAGMDPDNLVVRMQNDTATLENSLIISYTVKLTI